MSLFGKLFGKAQTHQFDYSEPEVGMKILSEYGRETMIACITGMSGIGNVEKLNEFSSHMAAAALQGDSMGVAFSCFAKHGKPFEKYLPIPVNDMREETFATFVELLKNNLSNGYSESAKFFLTSNGNNVLNLANTGNPCAQWLMGAWYSFDNWESQGEELCMQERMRWYEKSAFGGYLPAIQAVANFYDDSDKYPYLPTNLKKSAYWYRLGAIKGDSMCAFNLGVMYTQGDNIEKNSTVASLWLSIAFNNCKDPTFKNHISHFSDSMGIKLINYPDMNIDPELDEFTAEFTNVYQESNGNDCDFPF